MDILKNIYLEKTLSPVFYKYKRLNLIQQVMKFLVKCKAKLVCEDKEIISPNFHPYSYHLSI